MSLLARPFSVLCSGAAVLSLALAASASAYEPIATANLVTNTKNGRNEMPALDKKGQVIVFVFSRQQGVEGGFHLQHFACSFNVNRRPYIFIGFS